jgi:hypothetical protein
LQNNEQDQKKTCGGSKPRHRQEAAGWRASLYLQKGFECFVGFVTKKKYKVITIK